MIDIIDWMLPPAKSTMAGETDALFYFINIVSFIFLLGITIAIIYFSWKYRRRSEDDVTPVITHNNTLEITWSVIPLILVIIVFGWGFTGYMTSVTPPEDAYEIRVVGKSWLWEFHYNNGAVSINELHVPVNRPVKLVMTSTDVIHSFFVPDYRVKRDVLPNRYTSVWFEAIETGESIIYCTEYCGTAHADMIANVIVHEPDDFRTWLDTADAVDDDASPVDVGRDLVSRYGCLACHSLDGSQMIGPTLQGLWQSERTMQDGETLIADENYIRESILEPNARITEGYNPVMPSFTGTLNDRQIDAIIEYIKTLD
ncbi:MAG: cytochrome c oxidase subunit II [Balneolaceae bacterium]